ncbi:unnamed protein product [Adineta ricciae]|uniref:E3 ubiquitin-protein ligase RNF170 n=1 Tax=Adineta ricciae TaxID=249248 RepID=A0A815C530_ADIRI|nr:unnamed protein product [Adineta ricciae]CAF1282449.1 unnamed protein product [Adineta ricciae]
MPWYWPFKNDAGGHSSLVQGISDDTLVFFFAVAAFVALWISYTRRQRSNVIHPDNQQDVELLRQRNQDHDDTTTTSRSTRSGRSRHEMCPICLTEPSVLTVETNCGHVFCGKCIVSYWKFQSNWTSGLNCPVCRQAVTVLLKRFTAEDQATADNSDRQLVVTSVKDFNRRFSGAPRTWLEYFYDIPVLIPHIIRQIFSSEGLALAYRVRTLLIIVTVIAYVISPLDILPESLLGIFGLVDDFLVVLCAALYVIIAFRQSLARG